MRFLVISPDFQLSEPLCCQIGTDIEDYKCSWLVVQALEHADEDQLKILSVSMILPLYSPR